MGDSIYTKEADGSHSFQVIDDLGNAVKLASLDIKSTKTGWHYIVSKAEGIQDDDIKLIQVSKKNPDVRRNHTIKGVQSVKVFDKTNTEKESITLGEPAPKPNNATNATNMATDDIDDEGTRHRALEDTLLQLKELKPNRYYIFQVAETTSVIFKVNSNDGSNLNVEIISSTGADKDKYLALKGNEYVIPLTINNLSPSDGGLGWFNMGLVGGDGTQTLSNISDFVEYQGQDDNDQEDDQDTDQADDQEEVAPNKYKLVDFLKAHPDIASALHHQPKLFGMLDVGDPVGLAHVSDVINKFKDAKDVGDKFKKNAKVKFRIQNHDITLKVGTHDTKRYARGDDMRATVYKNKRGIVTLFVGYGTNNELAIKLLKELENDIYEAKFTLTLTRGGIEGSDSKKGLIRITDYNND